MKERRLRRFLGIGLALLLCALTAQPIALVRAYAPGDRTGARSAAPAPAQRERAGVSQSIHGVTVTLAELLSQPPAAHPTTPRTASPRRTFSGSPASALDRSALASVPSGSTLQPTGLGPDSPQTPVDKILGPTLADTLGFVPPDTMGAVGPTQFLFSVNTHLGAFNKDTPHTQIWDIDEQVFWGSTADPKGVSDTHVRYDRATQRWFITEIDVPDNNNHILLAVSSGPDLSTASWTRYQLPGTAGTAATDQNCFADYDTPGIDQNAIYIGANIFGGGLSPCLGANYKHSNLYVIPKAPLVLSNTANLTTFYAVITGTAGVETIQGVDSFDALPTGYAVAVDETESPRAHLDVWQINNPGTLSPTLSSLTTVPISPENGSLGGVVTANNVNNGLMDDLDDRLFSAVIRDGHLWTAHNIAVSASGASNSGTRDRDAMRWYDVNVSGLTLNQSGTVFDGASSGFLDYWLGTLMVSGQGHMAMGMNRANSATTVEAGAAGRLAGAALGTTLGFTRFQTSTADAYDDSGASSSVNRWGDYSYTSLDPCDDMTMWTAQEYVAGSLDKIDWGVVAEKLQAPPPATPSDASPAVVTLGQASVSVVVTGTAVNGSGFYDTPDSLTDPCRQRLTAAVSGNITVTSLSYLDPLHVQLNLATGDAALGLQTVTITNPDGQAAGASLLTIISPTQPTTTTLTSAPNTPVFGQSVTFTATVSGSGGPPTGSVTFNDGAPLGSSPLAGGVATFVTNTLSVGGHHIAATYNGDSTFLTSTSPSLLLNVSRANSLTALTSAPNPSVFGQSVTFTATVSASAPSGSDVQPTGSVTFFADSVLLDSSPLSGGVATFVTNTLAVGIRSITASFGGDGNFQSSTTSQPLLQTVNQDSSTTTLSSAPNPSQFGQSVTFTATVSGSGGPLTGTVTFYDGGLLGSSPLVAGVATFVTDTLPIGDNIITGTYSGNTDFLMSTSPPLTQTVDQAVYLPLVVR